ncbi:MAG: PQQ-binding-like beta-propeller repeat protein, partial [Candidatus Bathyarchaeia archaeon]
LKFDYAGQVYTWSGTYQNDTFMPASASTTIIVQEEPLPQPVLSYPLPTEYWTRPIEGQNTYWYTISSNWLREPFVRIGNLNQGGFQPDGIAPNSPHIMWSKPLQDGGVVGGSGFDVLGKTYYTGSSYNVRFSAPIVMHGRLYYQEPYGNSGGGGDYLCVDLRTGAELWRINVTATGAPSFGYLYSYDTGNQHGILPNGLLVASSTVSGLGTVWRGYDPRTGVLTTWNITNVPSGTAVAGPQGEILRYVLTNLGNSTHPRWYLSQWNSSKMHGTGLSPTNWYSGTWNASTSANYDWNISLTLGSGTWSINRASFNNIMLLTQGSFGSPREQGTGVNVTAISLKPESRGRVLWIKNYPPAPNNMTRSITDWDPDNGVFVLWDKETVEFHGYSLTDGNHLWSTGTGRAWDFFRAGVSVAYGKLYHAGYAGVLSCWDIKTGELLWTYGNGGPGNSTYAGLTTAWGHYPIFIDVIADGKIYLATTEHSADSPFYKGTRYRCVDAYTGKELWTLLGWGTGMISQYDVVADGFFVFLNLYDMKVYCVGKGPSATTVTASPKVSTHGNKVLIEGSVIDIAAGTRQHEQAARFPNGVPAVADESMSEWMEYVYMQKPRPADVKGVEVVISVLDPNNNCYEVGRAVSDANGMFSLTFEPPVPGKYTVIAEFKGSESYWPSYAETALFVEDAPPASPPPTPPPASIADTYFIPAVVGLLIAIIVATIINIVLIQRKR